MHSKTAPHCDPLPINRDTGAPSPFLPISSPSPSSRPHCSALCHCCCAQSSPRTEDSATAPKFEKPLQRRCASSHQQHRAPFSGVIHSSGIALITCSSSAMNAFLFPDELDEFLDEYAHCHGGLTASFSFSDLFWVFTCIDLT